MKPKLAAFAVAFAVAYAASIAARRALAFAGYLGGSGAEAVQAVAAAKDGGIWVAGSSSSAIAIKLEPMAKPPISSCPTRQFADGADPAGASELCDALERSFVLEALKRNTTVAFELQDPNSTQFHVCLYDIGTGVCHQVMVEKGLVQLRQ